MNDINYINSEVSNEISYLKLKKRKNITEITTCNFCQLRYITCSGKIVAEPAELFKQGNETKRMQT